jgi:3-oxoacyl-(acyl-carrier-protein) synthase
VTTKRRVAITGLGLVTPAGNTVADSWATLLGGRSRIGAISHFDAGGFPTRIAAEVTGFAPPPLADRKLLKFATVRIALRSRLPSRRCRTQASARPKAPTGAGPVQWEPG